MVGESKKDAVWAAADISEKMQTDVISKTSYRFILCRVVHEESIGENG